MWLVTNWNASDPGNDASVATLFDNTNIVTTAGFTIGGNVWRMGNRGGQAAPMPTGPTTAGFLAAMPTQPMVLPGAPESLAITGIPYPLYTIIAYFSSDTTNRLGTMATCGAGKV